MDQKPTEYQSTFTTAKQKKPVTLVVVTLLLILLTGGLGTVYYLKTTEMNNKISALQNQVDSSNTKLTVAEKQISETAVASSTEYRYIPELGVKYKVTDANRNVIYSYQADAKTMQVGFSLTTLATTKGSVLDGPITDICAGNDNPLGKIGIFKNATDPINIDSTTSAEKNGKKVGQYYYVYYPNSTKCSELMLSKDTSKDSTQANGQSLIKSIYDSLEAI